MCFYIGVLVQELKLVHLAHRGSHFELVISKRSVANKPKVMEMIPIYPTSTEYPNTFYPVTILTSYCSERRKLCAVEGEEFLFPKLS